MRFTVIHFSPTAIVYCHSINHNGSIFHNFVSFNLLCIIT